MSDDIRRVFLVDDHAIVRKGLTAYLGAEPDIRIVGEASNGRDALNRLAVLTDGEYPDVILMDLMMPVMDGLTAIPEILKRRPTVRIIAMTSFLEQAKVKGALEAGAVGYLLKDAEPADIVRGIRTAMDGQIVLQPQAATVLLAPRRSVGVELLTTREVEVVTLVASGLSNQQIALALHISERTARNHVSNVLLKLHLGSRTQAALWAVEGGVTTAHPSNEGVANT